MGLQNPSIEKRLSNEKKKLLSSLPLSKRCIDSLNRTLCKRSSHTVKQKVKSKGVGDVNKFWYLKVPRWGSQKKDLYKLLKGHSLK